MADQIITIDNNLIISPNPCSVHPGDTIYFKTISPGTFKIKFEKDAAFSSPIDITVDINQDGSQTISSSAKPTTIYYGVGVHDGPTFKVAAPPKIVIK